MIAGGGFPPRKARGKSWSPLQDPIRIGQTVIGQRYSTQGGARLLRFPLKRGEERKWGLGIRVIIFLKRLTVCRGRYMMGRFVGRRPAETG
jgi:hypothetical protein